MHTTPASLSRRMLIGLPMLLLAAFVWMGCNQGQSQSTDSEDDIPYQVGDALTDSTVALVVESDYGADTLSAQQYQQQIQMQMQRVPPNQRSEEQMSDMHKSLVRQFAAQHMLTNAAKSDEYSVDSAAVSQQLESIRSRYESPEQLEQELARNNVTIDSLRRYIASQLRQQQLQQEMADKASEPSEQELTDYAAENRSISAQHILLRLDEGAPQAQEDSVRRVAEALIDSAKGGADFAALARRHSEGPSASNGGSLGSFTKDRMVEPFAEAAFALSDSGDVAPEPVRTRFGYHVIRLTDPGQPMETNRARQQMMQERRRDAFDEELDKMLTDATVRANPDIVTAGLYDE